MSENKQALQVAALKNGTVIDHIPSEKLFTVVQLLGVEQMTSNITIGFNLDSKKLGKKGIIKIADKFFCDEEINRISVVAPHVKLNIIRDYEVVEKKEVKMPDELRGIVKCANPKCITNNEPMSTIFHVIDKDNCIVKCHYCEKRTETRRDNNPLTSAHHRLHGFTQIFILWNNNIYICVNLCNLKKMTTMKQDWKPGTMIYPLPAVLVSCGKEESEYNMFTVAWTGTICTNPPMCIYPYVRNAIHTILSKKNMEFVINLTNQRHGFCHRLVRSSFGT